MALKQSRSKTIASNHLKFIIYIAVNLYTLDEIYYSAYEGISSNRKTY